MIIVRVGFMSSRKLTVLGIHESITQPKSAIRFASSSATASTAHTEDADRRGSVVEMKSIANEITQLFDTDHDGTLTRRDGRSAQVVPQLYVSESTLIPSKKAHAV